MPGQPPRTSPGRDSIRPGDKRGPRRTTSTASDSPEEHASARSRVTSALALGVTQRAIALAVTVAVLMISFVSSAGVYFSQQREIAQVKAEIAASRAKIDSLQDELNRWQDPAYVQAQARERLGWVMPGEVGYRVIDAEGNIIGGTILNPAVVNDEESKSWYETLWLSLVLADKPVPLEPPTPTAPATVGPEDTESPR